MKEKINVFGLKGCMLPNGNLCEVCCKLFEHPIHESFGEVTVKKALSPCPYLKSLRGEGRGCLLHKTSEQTDVCANFHCSQYPDPEYIIAGAIAFGEITCEEAASIVDEEALERIIERSEQIRLKYNNRAQVEYFEFEQP